MTFEPPRHTPSSLHMQHYSEADVDGVYLAIARKTLKEMGKKTFKRGEVMPDDWGGILVNWHLIHTG